jgi:hypothetical protein
MSAVSPGVELDLVELPDQPSTDFDGIPPELLDEPPEVDVEGVRFESSPFVREYEKRVRQNRDLTVIVSDWNNERGTGKTTLSCKLADYCDRTDEGLVPSKGNIQPQQFINGYTAEPKGSGLVLDEAEAGANAREAMTIVNRVLSKIMSMARVEEKYVFINMPAAGHIDKNILDLADFWILVQRRGVARVYRLEQNPFRQKTFPSPTQTLSWSADLGGRNVASTYRSLSV